MELLRAVHVTLLLMESKGPEQAVKGDDVRNVRFARGGHDASQVDNLLERVAEELDADDLPDP